MVVRAFEVDWGLTRLSTYVSDPVDRHEVSHDEGGDAWYRARGAV